MSAADSVSSPSRWLSPVNLSLVVSGLILIHIILDHVATQLEKTKPVNSMGETLAELSVPLREKSTAAKAVQVCSRAQAAGLDFVDADGSVERTLRNLAEGGTVKKGPLAGSFFQFPLPESEIARLEAHLVVRDGRLEKRAD